MAIPRKTGKNRLTPNQKAIKTMQNKKKRARQRANAQRLKAEQIATIKRKKDRAAKGVLTPDQFNRRARKTTRV